MKHPRGYGTGATRRLPDTYDSEVTRAMRERVRGLVSLTQFEFLDGADPEDLQPRGGRRTSVRRDTRR